MRIARIRATRGASRRARAPPSRLGRVRAPVSERERRRRKAAALRPLLDLDAGSGGGVARGVRLVRAELGGADPSELAVELRQRALELAPLGDERVDLA